MFIWSDVKKAAILVPIININKISATYVKALYRPITSIQELIHEATPTESSL